MLANKYILEILKEKKYRNRVLLNKWCTKSTHHLLIHKDVFIGNDESYEVWNKHIWVTPEAGWKLYINLHYISYFPQYYAFALIG